MSHTRNEFLATYGHDDHINGFANHDHASLRALSASSPLLTKENLDKVVTDEDPYVQYHAVSNPNLTPEHFEKLSKHYDTDVRSAVTRNKNLPDDILHKLRADDSFTVRKHADWVHERRTKEKWNQK